MESNPTGFDAQKAEAFAGRLLGALNEGAFCLMVSIGHRTGLFDAMRDQAPLTSEELRYTLPPEHAAFLTRQAKADNMSVFGQYVALLGSVEDDIVECFRKGGAFPTSGMDASTRSWPRTVASPCCPRWNRTSFRWFPAWPPSSSAAARSEAATKGLGNIEFVAVDASDLDEKAEPAAFDLIATFDAVHDQARPLNVLRGRTSGDPATFVRTSRIRSAPSSTPCPACTA